MATPSLRRTRAMRRLWIAVLVAPGLLIMTFFVFVPIASALAYSVFEWQGLQRGAFVGLQNFATVLFSEPYSGWTRNAFKHNVIVFVTIMVVQNGTAFVLAYALFCQPWGHRLHQVTVFVPVILSTVIVGFLWKLFYNPFGLVNQGLRAIGLDSLATPWLGEPETALAALIFANTWHFIGFPTLIYLAGMQRIPRDLIDAARMDGAGSWSLIRRIIWPLVAPATTVVFVLTFIGSFNWFEMPFIMAGLDGSPIGATDVLGLYFYRTAFGNQSSSLGDFGLGSALAVLIFGFVLVAATAWTLYLRRREIEF